MIRLAPPLATLAAAALIAGCGSSSSSSSTPSAPATTSSQASAATTATTGTTAAPPAAGSSGGCQTVKVPAPHASQHLKKPTLTLDPAKTYTVTIKTNCGTFAFTLDVKTAPKTSASFYYLVKQGYFTGLTFPRVAAGFVIQGGSPTDGQTGGPGYETVEPPPANTQYTRGTVAMAKSEVDPNGGGGSQFFIVTAANATQTAGLTPVYAVFGKVVSGQKAIDAIGALPTDPPQDGEPSPAVVMETVSVATSG